MPDTQLIGFSRGAVEELSRQKGEPEWMLQKRLQAWDIYENMQTPLGRRGDLGTLRMFSNFKFQQLNPYVPSNGNGTLPASIEQSLQEALVDQRSGLVVQRNASVERIELEEELKRQGVILTDLDTAVRDYPELLQQYFMTTCVPVNSTKYTALHAAFWSGGIFLYIPKGVEIEDLGSRVMLSDIGVGLSGNGSAGELVGIFFTDHDQRYSLNTLSNHAAIATNAETLVKGVLTDESRVEFIGMIRVQPKAQQTASFLSDHTLLLSQKCRAESIPSLEIGANEVSASHGATTGKIDEEQLFYLIVRGIPPEEAERIIVQG